MPDASPPEPLGTDSVGRLVPSFACRTCGHLIARAGVLEGGVVYVYVEPVFHEPERGATYFLDDGWLTKFPAGENTAAYRLTSEAPRYRRHVEGTGACR